MRNRILVDASSDPNANRTIELASGTDAGSTRNCRSQEPPELHPTTVPVKNITPFAYGLLVANFKPILRLLDVVTTAVYGPGASAIPGKSKSTGSPGCIGTGRFTGRNCVTLANRVPPNPTPV